MCQILVPLLIIVASRAENSTSPEHSTLDISLIIFTIQGNAISLLDTYGVGSFSHGLSNENSP